jgi:hypothetical protein
MLLLTPLGYFTWLTLTRAPMHQPFTYPSHAMLVPTTNVFILDQDLNIGLHHSSPLYPLVK